jgi:hypothetical protein
MGASMDPLLVTMNHNTRARVRGVIGEIARNYISRIMSTISATTRSIWIKLPPILKPKPSNQSTNKTIMIVQSMD